MEELLAEDYELEEEKFELTKKELATAWNVVFQGNPDFAKDFVRLKQELGFGE